MKLLSQIPCWYYIIGITWSAYQGFRGVREQCLNFRWRVRQQQQAYREPFDQYIVLYIHDFAFRFICTLAGFLALYVSYFLASDTTALFQLQPGSGLLLTFSFLIGVIGVGGQLHWVILIGKSPWK